MGREDGGNYPAPGQAVNRDPRTANATGLY
jgi:hypothetical protein